MLDLQISEREVSAIDSVDERDAADSFSAPERTKLKVANVITGLNVGGAEHLLLRFLEGLTGCGYDPAIIPLMQAGPLSGLAGRSGFSVHPVGMRQHRIHPRDLGALHRRFSEVAPDLVHGWMYHGNLAATFAARRSRAPVIWSMHHSLDDITNESAMTRAVIRACAFVSRRVAAISYCAKTVAEQHEAVGFDRSKRTVIYNGTDCDRFRPDAEAGARLREMTGIPASRRIVGNFGRVHPMKDQSTLVRAVALAVEAGHDLHLLLIGNGHRDGPPLRLARELGLTDRVTTFEARDDIEAIAPGIDIYALSSAWGEAFSLAAAEAMASGVPTVVTDVGDSDWLVGDPGRVVPAVDPQAMAAVLGRLADLSRDELQTMGRIDRHRVAANFSLADYVEAHAELYARVLEQSR